MIALPIGYKVHTPLLSRLSELVQQRSFCDRPNLGWVTENYLDSAYLDRLLEIAPSYGMKTLLFDEGQTGRSGFFHWRTALTETPSLVNWLTESAAKIRSAGLQCGIVVCEESEKEFLQTKLFPGQTAAVQILVERDVTILDAAAGHFGGGRLPYLAIDRMIRDARQASQTDQPVFVRIDRPGRGGETLATWGNVYALSYHLLSGEENAETITADYCRCCFGPPADQLSRMFALARKAVEKSFLVLDRLPVMDESCWPDGLAWLDRQVERCVPPEHPLFRPASRTIAEIDFEKIEAMEAAHDAWKILEGASAWMDLNGFLWLEHYLLHLKVVCHVLRLLTVGYFKYRAHTAGTMSFPSHIFRAIGKDIYNAICDHRAILAEFDKPGTPEGVPPLQAVLTDWQRLNALD